jgi:hypothetical protein
MPGVGKGSQGRNANVQYCNSQYDIASGHCSSHGARQSAASTREKLFTWQQEWLARAAQAHEKSLASITIEYKASNRESEQESVCTTTRPISERTCPSEERTFDPDNERAPSRTRRRLPIPSHANRPSACSAIQTGERQLNRRAPAYRRAAIIFPPKTLYVPSPARSFQ